MVNITALAWKIIEAHGKRKGYLYENHKDESKNGQVDLGQARASYGWGKAFKEARESLAKKPVVIKQEKLQPAAFQIKSTRIANTSSKPAAYEVKSLPPVDSIKPTQVFYADFRSREPYNYIWEEFHKTFAKIKKLRKKLERELA